ncbi:MAG: hypothetical protein KBT06_04540 [Prevotellaceae bacterium]|nr:hypothetical protein [Candidatus Colivivens equi]
MSFVKELFEYLKFVRSEKLKHELNIKKLGQEYDIQMEVLKKLGSKVSDNEKSALLSNDLTPRQFEDPIQVFIAHPADEVSKEKWHALKIALESISGRKYAVFDDLDSVDENDIKYCKDHMNSSTIILVLVGDEEPFTNVSGVFFEELKHLGGHDWAQGKLIYICSYGIKDPLDIIVNNNCDKQYLVNLKTKVKGHYFNIDNMMILAQNIDDQYQKLQTKNKIRRLCHYK